MTTPLFKWALAPLAAAAITASSATAAVVTFDLTGDDDPIFNELPSKVKLQEGSASAVFNARSIRGIEIEDGIIDAEKVRNARIGLFADGAGALSRTEGLEYGVDGVSKRGIWRDFLEVTFTDRGRDMRVTSLSLTFGNIGVAGFSIANDDFQVAADTDGSGRIRPGDLISGIFDADTQAVTVTGDDLFGGNVFGIFAGLDASWNLKTVSVEYTPVVPLPAGGLLLLTGLGGLAVARKRKG